MEGGVIVDMLARRLRAGESRVDIKIGVNRDKY